MPTTLTSRYQELQKRFPLRPIRSEAQRDDAQQAMESLAVRPEGSLSDDERDYLDVLSNLIEMYDRAHHPMPRRRGTPSARLGALLESSGTTPKALEKIVGLSQPQVSLILSGKRGISKACASKLASHFRVSGDFFL